jgi:hypothetical protein
MVKTDSRRYGQQDKNRVDCSKAVKEISDSVKDHAFDHLVYDKKFSESLAANMANHIKQKGEFSTNIKDAKIGDYIFFTSSSDNKQISKVSHVGIITNIDNKVITVASAEVTKAQYNQKTKSWIGGEKSFKDSKLAADGTIWRKHNGTGGDKFVGLGRPKEGAEK